MKLVVAAVACAVFVVSKSEARGVQEHRSGHHFFKKHHGSAAMDGAGKEYLMCVSTGMGEKTENGQVTKCQAENEESMGVKSLGLACMGVFDQEGHPMKQGCWIHQMDDVISKTCAEDGCYADGEYGPYFCCCTTPLCNKSFKLRENTETSF